MNYFNIQSILLSVKYFFESTRSLQVYLDDITDEKLHMQCQNVFFKLGSGIHPTVDEVMDLVPLFKDDGPFNLRYIRAGHLVSYILYNFGDNVP